MYFYLIKYNAMSINNLIRMGNNINPNVLLFHEIQCQEY